MTQPRLLGGRYELDGIVGRGGMAEVYRARDIRLDRIVAVKTLREDLARDQTFQARFRREAQSAASLNNPSIVAVYDTGEDDTGGSHIPYIVMEYVDGRTLRDLLRDDRRLLPERALEITDGVLRALEYSHRSGIVHRDIKPGNVMLTRNGQVKVMDFGIARAISDEVTTAQMAQVIGTAQYLSPEQARGERVDARSDLYSIGCLLYELLTGRPPFLGDSPVAIAYQHVRENPTPPSQLGLDVPPETDAVVLRAMAKDPGERYQSAGQMRTDIQHLISRMQKITPAAGPGDQPKIFLCYRRGDTQGFARGIYQNLAAKYGHEQVFRDIDSTPAGVRFAIWIESRVSQCSVMIVLIGDAWLSAKDQREQRRLDLPGDWVRQEIEVALRRDIPIIPVRVQGARMPSEAELPPSIADLTGFQSAEVTDSRWDFDVGLLIQAIDNLITSD
jgi:serine/threonine protein kinase